MPYKIIQWSSCSFFSVTEGTFFSLFRKPIYEVCEIIKCWSAGLTCTKAEGILRLGNIDVCRQTIAGVYGALRNVCSFSIQKSEIKLGGRGHVVEIDESIYARV